jgi:hypothetical protein
MPCGELSLARTIGRARDDHPPDITISRMTRNLELRYSAVGSHPWARDVHPLEFLKWFYFIPKLTNFGRLSKVESEKIIDNVKKREMPRFAQDPPGKSVVAAVDQLSKLSLQVSATVRQTMLRYNITNQS